MERARCLLQAFAVFQRGHWSAALEYAVRALLHLGWLNALIWAQRGFWVQGQPKATERELALASVFLQPQLGFLTV